MKKQAKYQRGDHLAALMLVAVVAIVGVLGFVGYNTWQKSQANAGKKPPAGSTAGVCTRYFGNLSVNLLTYYTEYPDYSSGSQRRTPISSLPGDTVPFQGRIYNNDRPECNDSVTYTVKVELPAGFKSDIDSKTITLGPTTYATGTSGYSLTSDTYAFNITSPTSIASGKYPVKITYTRQSTGEIITRTSDYIVYQASEDKTQPIFDKSGPSDASSVRKKDLTDGKGRIFNSLSDDRRPAKTSIKLDGREVASTDCSNSFTSSSDTYRCVAVYNPSDISIGQHTIEHTGVDQAGNISVKKATFTVTR